MPITVQEWTIEQRAAAKLHVPVPADDDDDVSGKADLVLATAKHGNECFGVACNT